MIIRECKIEDLFFIATVCRDASKLYDPIIPGAFERQAIRYEKNGFPKEYTINIIEKDKTKIGFCAYTKLNNTTWYLVGLYILSKYQK